MLPKTLGGRLILLMLATLLLVQGVSVLVYLKDRNEIINNASARLMMQRIAALVRLVDQSEPPQYDAILKATEGPQLALRLSAEPVVGNAAAQGEAAGMQHKLYAKTGRDTEQAIHVTYDRLTLFDGEGCDADEQREHWHKPSHLERFRDGGEHAYWRWGHRPPFERRGSKGEPLPFKLTVAVLLENGTWLNIRAGVAEDLSLWNWRSALGLLVVGVFVVGLMLWILRSNTQPLRKLAQAADKIGRGVNTKPLAEEGAEEVRSTIQAFNLMQERQQRFIKDRTLMLAAISHDLRTPITKLRLQSEFVGDAEIRDKMLTTLTEMEGMIKATMNFARDDMENEPSRLTDLVSLVESLCDDLIMGGAQITTDLPGRLVCECKPTGIRRMVSNVLDNAVNYANSVQVRLWYEGDHVVLQVNDDGPGIDEALFEQVFSPFYRVEGSRNRATGGMGLGLSVVRNIAHLHGGEVRLRNRERGGLQMEIWLPC